MKSDKEIRRILQELLVLPAENECVEFKEAKHSYDFKDIGKYFSALSNEANLKGKPEAWLVFGVNNKQTITGTQFRSSRKDLDHLKYEIAEKVNNRLTFIEIYEIQVPEGRVILFQIPAAPKGIPTSFGGFWFGREGESVGPLNIQELEQIRQQSNNFDWSSQICEGASLDDLDGKAIARARKEYANKFPAKALEMQNWDDITFLNKAKVAINGKITRAAILLLGKEESEHLNMIDTIGSGIKKMFIAQRNRFFPYIKPTLN